MRLIFIILVFMIGCATVPHSTDVLVGYPMEGKVVWMYEDGRRSPYFIIDHEDFIEFLEREREIEKEKKDGVHTTVR